MRFWFQCWTQEGTINSFLWAEKLGIVTSASFINDNIPPRAFQFLHPYLINQHNTTPASMRTKSSKCKQRKNLTVLSWNISGSLFEKTQPHGSLYNCALLYEPTWFLYKNAWNHYLHVQHRVIYQITMLLPGRQHMLWQTMVCDPFLDEDLMVSTTL